MTLKKEIIGDEFYLYVNGKIIYKKWLKTGYSKVFDVMAYDKYTLLSIAEDTETEKNKKQLPPTTPKKH
ncbi:hypothetical protein AHMF7605_12285 [Adhaeribacter arboris]|uniref:Uncharacterized protein n=1 Tax=Adhaeribacter arboris TaxID=2072846 RepID=A0A2T2YFF1_9BACT|nr:hypothetical protein [Adhaeribacter arboris]PSR54246.1 hypothetical protein AHMF7605_12285 [Adhaeribacter arboris]